MTKKKLFLFFLIMSIVILLFTTKYSILYPFNDWQDSNSFLTVARSVLNGKILYKDIIEQKGPILYIIYMIGYLTTLGKISGIFILEVLSLTIVFYYSYKIINIFVNTKYDYLLVPIFGVFICTSYSFVHGGSAEEFCLPFLMISLYYFLYHFMKKELTYKQIFINGIISMVVALIKFSLLGFWFGFMAIIFFDLMSKKEYKKAFVSCFVFLLGMFIVGGIFVVYFLLNDALGDFIYSYFLINAGSYARESSNIFTRIFKCFGEGFVNLGRNIGFLILLPFLIYSIFKIFKNNKLRIAIISIFTLLFLGIYIGLRAYKYYTIPLLIFYIFIFVYINIKFKNKINKVRINYIVLTVYVLLIGISSYMFANYRSYLFTSKEDYAQFRIADIIKEDSSNPTILNYGSLDYGFYNILNVIPNCKYFHRMNILYEKLPDNYDIQKEYIIDKKVDYVIIGIRKDNKEVENDFEFILNNYEIIYEDYQIYEKYMVHFYLLKIKK